MIISRSHHSLDKAKAFEIGCADYISKPFEITELLMRLDKQLTFQATRKQVDQLNKELEQRVLERTLQLQTVHQRLKAKRRTLRKYPECPAGCGLVGGHRTVSRFFT